MKEKTMREQDAFRFAREMVALYFGKRDMAALLNDMEERTSWIGTGEGELIRNLSEARAALTKELSEYDGGFAVTDCALEFAPLSETAALYTAHWPPSRPTALFLTSTCACRWCWSRPRTA